MTYILRGKFDSLGFQRFSYGDAGQFSGNGNTINIFL